MKEIWKDIVGYEGLYQVSNLGNVKSKRKVLSQTKGEYLKVNLSKNGKEKVVNVHRLVAQAFIPNIDNLPQVNHKDENKYNNKVENLEWCDNKYNNNYKDKAKRSSIGQSKYKIVQKDKNNNIIKTWSNIWELRHSTNYETTNIRKCCKGQYEYAYGYKWEYEQIKPIL